MDSELGGETSNEAPPPYFEYSVDELKRNLLKNPEINLRRKFGGPLLKETPEVETEICCKIWKMIDKFIKINQPCNINGSNFSKQKSQNSKSVTMLLRKEFFATVRTDSSLSSSDASSDLSNNTDQVQKTPTRLQEATVAPPTVKRLKQFKQTVTKRFLKDNHFAKENRLSSLDESLTLPFDVLHYIIGCGIIKTHIRDEIYTQLIILTSSNHDTLQKQRLWLLLQCTLSCFLPTVKILPYLSKVIKESPSNYNPSLQNLLARGSEAGSRFQPPSYIEFKALKKKKVPTATLR